MIRNGCAPQSFNDFSIFTIFVSLVVLFYVVSTDSGSFNAELNFKQFSIAFCLQTVRCQNQFYFKQFSLA